MKNATLNEMRTVDGGYDSYCRYCQTTFSDTKVKFLWWTITLKTGQQKNAQHLRKWGTTCMYASDYKK